MGVGVDYWRVRTVGDMERQQEVFLRSSDDRFSSVFPWHLRDASKLICVEKTGWRGEESLSEEERAKHAPQVTHRPWNILRFTRPLE